jgi:hypothetical protein
MQFTFSLFHKTLSILGILTLLWGCAAPTANIGKTVATEHILPPARTTEQSSTALAWQTKDLQVSYKLVKNGNTFTVSGTLHIGKSITRSFPLVERLDFYIHFLDENGAVLASHEISPNTGYLRNVPDTLPLLNVPQAPQGSSSFTFSYWAIFRGSGIANENPGEWEIYFNPFIESSSG